MVICLKMNRLFKALIRGESGRMVVKITFICL